MVTLEWPIFWRYFYNLYCDFICFCKKIFFQTFVNICMNNFYYHYNFFICANKKDKILNLKNKQLYNECWKKRVIKQVFAKHCLFKHFSIHFFCFIIYRRNVPTFEEDSWRYAWFSFFLFLRCPCFCDSKWWCFLFWNGCNLNLNFFDFLLIYFGDWKCVSFEHVCKNHRNTYPFQRRSSDQMIEMMEILRYYDIKILMYES